MAFLSRTVPELEAVSLSFLFPSREAAFKLIDGPVGDLLEKKLSEKGFTSLVSGARLAAGHELQATDHRP